MILNEDDYNIIHEIVFQENYPGYTPSIIESPNGDHNWDSMKQYAHVSPKYLNKYDNTYNKKILYDYYNKAIKESQRICDLLNIDNKFYPGTDSILRILRYPVGAVTHPHTDFDLFTLCLYRNVKETFKYLDDFEPELLKFAKQNSDGIHFGEIITEILNCQATKHEVIGCNKLQKSIVFFVVPNHNCMLPSNISVGNWINNRKLKSRKQM